jgi:hypothetical protein
MAASRETILNALFAQLSTLAVFKFTSRRDREPESITPAMSPALFLVEPGEKYERPSVALPPKRTLHVDAIFYNNVGPEPNLIPLTLINNALDALDAALTPTSSTYLYTLNGLVDAVYIDGEVEKRTGAKTGAAAAIVPIAIRIP